MKKIPSLLALTAALGLALNSPEVDIVGITSHNPEVASVTKGGEKVDLKYKDDYIAFSGVGTPEARRASLGKAQSFGVTPDIVAIGRRDRALSVLRIRQGGQAR